ncbi:MAG TPA: von Willebrand factor type A domain-containing protein [Luteolibacter sp.]|nr:von Willebrand factor type A domain-containing protein [Luteolibacter sp.]
MNDETDIPLHPSADEVVEARIVAWVLGEASAFEIAELERLCAEKPELAAFHQRMLALQGLLTDAVGQESGDEWKLPEEKAKTLHEAFGEVVAEPVVEKKKRPLWKRPQPWIGVAACLAVSTVVWRYNEEKYDGSYGALGTASYELPASPVAKERDAEVRGDLSSLRKAIEVQEDKVEERRRALSNIVREKSIVSSGKMEKMEDATKRSIGRQDYAAAKQEFEQELDTLQTMKLSMVREQVDSGSLASAPSGIMTGGLRSGDAEITRNHIDAILSAPASPAASAPMTAAPAVAAKPREARTRTIPPQPPTSEFKSKTADPATSSELTKREPQIDPLRRSLYMAEGNYNLGKYDDAKKDYEAVLRTDPDNAAARRGLERLATAKSDYYRAAYDHTRAELLMEVGKAWELDVPKVEKRQEEMDLFAKTAESTPGQNFDMNLRLGAERSSGVGGGMGYGMADTLNNPGEPQEALAANDMISAADPFAPGESSVAKLSAREPITPSEEIYLNGQILPLVEASKGFDSDYDGSVSVKDLSEMGTVALAAKPTDFDEITAAQEAFSTFSLNVSDVSFQLALSALERGETPDPAGIKAEQFYNAVDYGDPAPSGDPIAAKIEQSAHPVIPGRNLVRLGVKTASAGRNASQPLHLTLLIDQSGSMVRDDRRAALDKALGDLAGLLTEKDRVSVIGFSRTPSLLADGIAGNQLGPVTGMMNREAAEAGTNLEEAIGLAEQVAVRQMVHEAGNRIVLFTDGAANLGDADPARLADKVRDLRQQGVAFDVAGIGADGLNDKLLAELARNGDGRYLFAAGNIADQLAGAFRPAAEDVKVQVRFNPERVSRYKLIGFEEDRLKKEDFRNDAVDAAELSADEAAVALYQVELIPGGKGEIGEMSVRFRDSARGEMVERSWTIAHDGNAPAFDRSAPSMQLAGLSMLAAEKLKGGPMAGLIDFNRMNASTAKVRQYYANSSKAADMLRLIGLLRR